MIFWTGDLHPSTEVTVSIDGQVKDAATMVGRLRRLGF